MNFPVAGGSVSLLHVDDRYRIGIDPSLSETKGIDQIAKQYGGYLDVRPILLSTSLNISHDDYYSYYSILDSE